MPKKILTSPMFIMMVAILIITTGCASGKKGVFPGEQCIALVQRSNENISVKFLRDADGCIIEDSVTFYGSPNCTDSVKPHEFKPADPNFVFASSPAGGCPPRRDGRPRFRLPGGNRLAGAYRDDPPPPGRDARNRAEQHRDPLPRGRRIEHPLPDSTGG